MRTDPARSRSRRRWTGTASRTTWKSRSPNAATSRSSARTPVPIPAGPIRVPPAGCGRREAGFVRRDFRPWPARTIVQVGLRAGGRRSPADLIEDRGESAEASPEEEEYLRILAGEPRWGAELDERSLPLQCGLSAHVRLGKGCYIGQEYVARQAHRGRIPRLLRRLEFDGGIPAAGGIGGPLSGPSPAGRVTSAASRPDGWSGPAGIALAVVSADVPAGAAVQVLRGPAARLLAI